MQHAHYNPDLLYFDGAPLDRLAREYGTPLYVYSESALAANFRRIDEAFAGHAHLICYALKANSNPALLQMLAALGAGADVVSGGELHLALQAGISPQKIVFAGVGKRDDEIVAALDAGILGINVESAQELAIIEAIARERDAVAPVSLRINPDIDIHGHPYISTGRTQDKFGIAASMVAPLLPQIAASPHLRLVGVHAHIGSMISDLEPYRQLGVKLRDLVREALAAGHSLRYIDTGGGLGVRYQQPIVTEADARGSDDLALDPKEVAAALLASLREFDCQLVFEPGRALVAGAGLLLTEVLYVKETPGKSFIVVDAGMTELIRPSLYGAYHAIVPVRLGNGRTIQADVVGPICESGDFLARDRELPALQRGDLLAVLTAGAYGFTLSSNYNARPRPAEVMVANGDARLVRPRQAVADLWR